MVWKSTNDEFYCFMALDDWMMAGGGWLLDVHHCSLAWPRVIMCCYLYTLMIYHYSGRYATALLP